MNNDITLIIAVYGAVIASVSLLWQFLNWFLNLLNYRRDRADLKIWVKGGYKVFPIDTIYEDKLYLRIEVANKGRRPATLTACSIRLPRGSEIKGDWLLLGESAKKIRLEEGDAHTYMAEQAQLADYNLTDKDIVVCVSDATGKFYWADNVFKRWVKLWRSKRKVKEKQARVKKGHTVGKLGQV